MRRRPLRPPDVLPSLAALSVVVAIMVVVLSSSTGKTAVTVPGPALVAAGPGHGSSPPSAASPGAHSEPKSTRPPTHRRPPAKRQPAPGATTGQLTLAKAIGQLIVARFAGTHPTPSILDAIRAGRVGAIILFHDNTLGSASTTRILVDQLQSAASDGGNPGLLIMTDQEGGLVKRLDGPPMYAASRMSDPTVAGQQGAMTAQLLRAAGVNVDLAPVADVSRVDGFMTTEERTFGSDPATVALAACAFAEGLSSGGVAYTLKHFPGLGDAVTSTDNGPVTVSEPASLLHADEAAYQQCGNAPLALVMVSSASYSALTGGVPAVMSPVIYGAEMRRAGIDAVTISDDLEAPALAGENSPARQAISAGLDLAMYAQTESAAENAYARLLQDAQQGSLSSERVQAAAQAVLALKRSLHLM